MARVGSWLGSGRARLRSSARSSIVRLGREEEARKVLMRLREARSVFDVELRRDEPIPELHDRLVRQFPSVDVRQAALYEGTGTASFTPVLGMSTRPDCASAATLK